MNRRKPLNTIDDAFLKSFADKYNSFKAEKGLIPVCIREKMLVILGCKSTTYYHYLRLARKKGFIEDTYEENTLKRRERERKIRKGISKIVTPEEEIKNEPILTAEIKEDEVVAKTVEIDNKQTNRFFEFMKKIFNR